jgi:hypothetical protein
MPDRRWRPPLLRRWLVPGTLTGLLLRSLKRLCFLDTDAIGSQPRDYRLSDVARSRQQIAMGRPVDRINQRRRHSNAHQFLQILFHFAA